VLQKFNCPGGRKNLDLVKLIGMKKIIAFGAVAFYTLVLLGSCTKSSSDRLEQNTSPSPERVITTKVAPGQIQTVTIDDIGELSIVRQALHFKISQTGIDPKNNSRIYSYSPAEGFTGTDEVLLAHKISTSYSGSGSCNYGDSQNMGSSLRISYVAVKITVAAN